jgi:hemerythrin-like domain-containing protein
MAAVNEYRLSTLLCEHDELDDIFAKHQRALLVKDIRAALATIVTFENTLGRHIRYEDEVLLPLYSAKGAETEGGTLSIFHAEHRKLLESTAGLVRKTEALDSSSDLLDSILKLLDEEALFKGLFSHHALREQNLLFPRLDAYTTKGERQKALEQYSL